MTQPKAIGIDLGTTNSAVAWIDSHGRTAMVPNAEGELLTPSVVLFEDKEVVVGKAARTATVLNPERVAVWVKRDMGAPVYNRPIRGEYLPPEVIQACILRKLRSDVVQVLGPQCRCVITVPAYFDEPRRKATADAGEMAGLQILDIVNEPTAGALAFGETLGYLSPTSAPKEEMTVMVYDLGGGTFDVTLLRLGPGKIQTLATDGDVQLGGYDWDLRVVDYVAESFKRAHSVDPRENPATMGRLFNAAMEAKHSLSARSQTIMRLDYQGHTLDVPLSRRQFEDLTADLLERTAYTTRQVLTAAKLQWKNIDRVLLVGGSTRMPSVPKMLAEMTGRTPDHTVNPDEAVARGAAIYAHYLITKQLGSDRQPAFEVTNVNSHSLGIEGIDHQTLRKKNVILIPRNTPLPAKIQQRFATKSDGQRSIVLQVLEGESSLPGDCTAIGRTVIRDLPPTLTKGWPVDVTFEYGANGRLSVHATVPGANREVKLDMERAVGLSSEGVARWKQAVSGEGGFGAFESMALEVLGMAGAEAVPMTAGAAVAPAKAAPVPLSAPRSLSAPTPRPAVPPAVAVVPPTAAVPPVAAAPPVAASPQPAAIPMPVSTPISAAAPLPAAATATAFASGPAPILGFNSPSGMPLASTPMPLSPVAGPVPSGWGLGAPATPALAGVALPPPGAAPLPLAAGPAVMPPIGSPGLPLAGGPPAPLPPGGPPLPGGPPPVSGSGTAVDSFDLAGAREGRKSNISRRLISVIGYVTSAIVGLGAGYLLLHWLQPQRFPWP